jgi:hypothetical protein
MLVLAAVALPVGATAGTLTFEGLQDFESIGNFYNGGLGGSGSGPGTNYGITFSPDATAFIQTLIPDGSGGYIPGGTGLFGGAPSPDTALMFCDGACSSGQTAETMDVAGGFSGGFSLYYSAPFSGGQLDIYSGLDGQGSDLGTLQLQTTALSDSSGDGNCDEYGAPSDPGAPACPFVPVGLTFGGTAQSVVFTGATDAMFFDDVTFDTLGTGASAPEPAAGLMVAAGLAGIVYSRKRQMCA